MSGAIDPRLRSVAAIAAATLLNLPFGTIYAFSVFLAPFEQSLGVGRAQMSGVFALAAISLTVGMVAAPSIYRRAPALAVVSIAGVISACGLWIAAAASTLAELALGYGVLFGIGGGIGYIVVLQGVNQTVRSGGGLVNGYIVALYPIGAMLGAPLLGASIAAWGAGVTLAALGGVVVTACVGAGLLLSRAGVRMGAVSQARSEGIQWHWPVFSRMFLVFFLAAAAGLMVMSQIAAMIQAYGGGSAVALGATTMVTAAIAASRILGGWLVDRLPVPWVSIGAHVWSLTGALLLLVWPGPLVAIFCLAMIGMGYGLVSGATAGAIPRYWRRDDFGRIASLIYIAWCIAAISLPVLAGWLFDLTRGYSAAIAITIGVNLLGVVIASGLPVPGSPPTAQRQ
jgi:MFS transporter, OFA family, oxalate/formate antiporter